MPRRADPIGEVDLVPDRDTPEPLSPHGRANEAIRRTDATALLVVTDAHRTHVACPPAPIAAEAEEGPASHRVALGAAAGYPTSESRS